MTVSFSLLDEFKATVWRQARVLDRESLPSFPAVFPIFRGAGQAEPGSA
jgi:hypothetical protein